MAETLPILLVPGLGGSPRIYRPQIPHLWNRAPVTVVNHIRDDSIAGIAARILDEAPKRFALCGHSMGGYISFEIMRQAPERVERLALLNTQARVDAPDLAARRKTTIKLIETDGLDAAVDAMFPNLVHPSRVNDAALRRLVGEMRRDVGIEPYLRQFQAVMNRIDSRPTLASIRCPTLVLSGDEDNTILNQYSREIADGITGSKYVLLQNCGHLAQVEQPEAVTAALLDWLKM